MEPGTAGVETSCNDSSEKGAADVRPKSPDVKSSRMDGLAAAFGMGVGGATFGTLALLGFVTILLQVEWLYLALRLLGGLYLVYLGIRIWRGASEPFDIADAGVARQSSMYRSFTLGLVI